MTIDMLCTYMHRLIQEVFAHAAWVHWVAIAVLALALTGWVLMRKKASAYGAVCLGLTVFAGLFLVDTAVLIRIGDGVAHKTGFDPAYERKKGGVFVRESRSGTAPGIKPVLRQAQEPARL